MFYAVAFIVIIVAFLYRWKRELDEESKLLYKGYYEKERSKMNERFSKEWMSQRREVSKTAGLVLMTDYQRCLDEIERLQKLVDSTQPTGICEICTARVIEENRQLKQRVTELEQERRWISVSELSETIRALVYLGNDYTVIATYHKNTDKWKNDCGAIVENVLFYQHLPPPPEGDGESCLA